MSDIKDGGAALNALLAYQQADMDGIMVTTSRQAIHEVADELTTLRAENERLRATLKDVRIRIFKTDIDGDPWVIQSKIDAALQAGENE